MLLGVHGWKRVHGTIENEQEELATCSVCVTGGRAKVRASWSSWSEKSSWLENSSWCNRKRACRVRASPSSWSEKSSWYNRKKAKYMHHT